MRTGAKRYLVNYASQEPDVRHVFSVSLISFFFFWLYFCQRIKRGFYFLNRGEQTTSIRTNWPRESRWRNRTGRPLSLLQIHQKNNWTVNKVHKKLLIASSGHQAPRKAAHCLWREVGQNIKDKKGDKRARDGDPSREGSLNRGSFRSPGNPHTGGSGGSFQISEGNLTGRKN